MGCESIFEIKRFCCCTSLRIGSFIIGYLGLVGNVLQTAGGSAHMHYMQSFTVRNNNMTNYAPVNGYMLIYTEYMAIALAYHAVSILFHAALLWGIHKTRSEFILPWLVVKGFESILVVITVIVSTIVYMATPGMDVGVLFLLMAIFIICSWLVIYSYMCVYSYYLEIKPTSTPTPEHDEIDFPPTYIKTLHDDKKQNIADISITQNVI